MNHSVTLIYLLLALALPLTNIIAQSNSDLTKEAYYTEAVRLHEQGDYAEAVAYYNIAISMDPSYSKCLYNRGLALIEMEKYNKALADFNRLLQINPIDLDAYEQRGHLSYMTGDMERAISDFTMVIKSKPSASAYTNRGMAYLSLHQYPNSIRDLENAIHLDDQDNVAHRTLGDALFATNKPEEAIQQYNKALDKNPRDIIALNNRGNAYQLAGKDQLALLDYNKGIELLENSFTYTNRAKYWLKKENYEQALIDSKAASKLDFNNAEAYYCIGIIENARKNHAIASENFNKAIALNDQEPFYFNGRGLALFQLQEFEDALSDFESALVLNPADAAAKDRIADCHHRLQVPEDHATFQAKGSANGFSENNGYLVQYSVLEPEEDPSKNNTITQVNQQQPAEEIFYEKSVLAFSLVNTTNSTSQTDQAIQLMDMGHEYMTANSYNQAIQQYTFAIQTDIQLADAYYQRAQCYMLTNDLKNALADLDQYLLLKPEDANAYNNRGTLRFRNGNVFGAQNDYTKGITIDPGHAMLRSNRGGWYMHMGYFKEAVEDFTVALEIDDHNADFYYRRGLALFELKNYPRVEEDMNRAIGESSIERYEYYFVRGKSQLLSGNYESALGNFDKTLSLSPRFSEAYVYRSITKQHLNDKKGACEDYTVASSLGYKISKGNGFSLYCQGE